MEIQSLSDTYGIMSGGNQISLIYRGGRGGRFVTRQICSKSQLENIFAPLPGKKIEPDSSEKHHLGIIYNKRFFLSEIAPFGMSSLSRDFRQLCVFIAGLSAVI